MTACARFAPMIGARAGELTDEDARALADHLATCEACQARLADEVALSGMLSEALLDEANRRDFSRFSDEVLARIPEYAPSREAAGWAERGGLLGWIRQHRVAAALSTLVPAAIAAAAVLYLVRAPAPAPDDVYALDVTAEDRGAVILETSDGPVVVLGDSSAEGS